ncbi:MAG: hypothetical protein Q8S71_11935 [Hydrogenophaga sp.]|nr:hypothetical protein [Hydrogenophaga sp.]
MPAITLTHPTAGPAGTPLAISLPGNLLWVDQYTWSAVTSVKRYASLGALVIDSWVKQAGRPLTLQGTQDRAWCERGLLTTLNAWAADVSLIPTDPNTADPADMLSLNHGGTVYPVVFDTEQNPIDAEPLPDLLGGPSRYTVHNDAGQLVTDVDVDYFNPLPTDPFQVSLRFLIL